MKVKAKKMGYYNHKRIKPEEIFELKTVKGLDSNGNPITRTPEQQFSSKWMEKISEKQAKATVVNAQQKQTTQESEEGDGETNSPTGDSDVI